MNCMDECKWEWKEGGIKRKLSSMDSTEVYRVKGIKISVRRNEAVNNDVEQDEATDGDTGHGRE